MGDQNEVADTHPVESHGEEAGSEKNHVGDKYEVPAFESYSSFDSLKQRIRRHYELASDYYYSLWGQHIHHGYWLKPEETKEEAQVNLINLLLEISNLAPNSTVLDVGCGIGGTTRHLAREQGCTVTGITISGRQVQIAERLTKEEAAKSPPPTPVAPSTAESTSTTAQDFTPLGLKNGKVGYLELDAETMSTHFPPHSFDTVWISEALSHLPAKPHFFTSAATLLKPGGKLVVADWFKSPTLTPTQISSTIKPIEDGMLLPPLCTMAEYVDLAESAGLRVAAEPKDISGQVARTWDISWELVRNPSLWAFAISQGRDGLAFLQAFRAMRKGFAEGSFRYGVACFEKPGV